MSFDIKIKVDPTGATTGIKKVEGDLDKLEKKADQTSQKMTTGFTGAATALQGAFMAAGGVAAIGKLASFDDEFTNLHNSALKFADAGRNVSMVLADQEKLASDLHMNMKETIGAYDSVRDATDSLNLTYEQQIRLTKTLSEGAQISGKSSESAAAAFHSLKVSMETGMDPGRALTGMFKEFPDIADQLQAGLGKTSGEIVRMAKDGKLSFAEMTQGLIQNTNELDEKFSKRVETWGQKWDQFTHALGKPIDVQGAVDALYNVDMAIERVAENTAKLAKQWRSQEAAKEWSAFDAAVKAGTEEFEKRSKAVKEWQDSHKSTKEKTQELSLEAQILRDLDKPYQDLIARGHALNNLRNDELLMLPEYREEMGKVRDLLLEMGKIEVKSVAGGLPAPQDYTAGIKTPEPDASITMWKDGPDAKTQAWHDELKRINEDGKRLGETFRPVADALIDMFKQGELSAKGFEDALQGVAIQLLKMAAIQALGGGSAGSFVSGLLGGANGFDYVANQKALQLPGFARGGDALIGGAGGTDSKIAMFRVTPGESVHVRTPQQQAAAAPAQRPVGPTQVIVQTQYDRREILAPLSSHDGQVAIAKVDRRMGRRS